MNLPFRVRIYVRAVEYINLYIYLLLLWYSLDVKSRRAYGNGAAIIAFRERFVNKRLYERKHETRDLPAALPAFIVSKNEEIGGIERVSWI